MSSQIVLDLPDDVLERAESLARRIGRPVADVLVDAVKSSLRPLGPPATPAPPLTDWSDAEVQAAAESTMAEPQSERLSVLLERQREGELADGEPVELAALMQVYHDGTLTKARALGEAVRRGLRRPLEP
jgi:hypothetical protein